MDTEYLLNLNTIGDAKTAVSVIDEDSSYKSLEFTRLLFVAGAVGGVCAKMLISPIEVVVAAHTAELCLRSKLKKEGLSIFRTNPYCYLRMVPFAGSLCVTYGQLSSMLPDDGLAWHARIFAGCVAGGVATIATHPLDVLRSRGFSTLSPRVLFSGVGPAFVTTSVAAGVQQYVFDCCRSTLESHTDGHSPVSHFVVSGAVAGVVAQTIVHPLSLLSNIKNKTQSLSQTFLKRGGLRSLYAGLLPTYSRSIPAVAVTLTVRDAVLGRIDWER
eukprot:TRINITY_DN30445_c0_g1_i1.p1 TRINITY_DN30445_c0_g1~~TRINITY_DN30445_c0_g1_i1.p1  ORF type:complete len:272 (+),score=32.78 TRINITY_DN30445_c0_g1_i1:100-915(+)